MTTVRKKPAPTCSRCPHNGATWRELNGKRTWFCETHLKEAEREAAEAAAKRYEESRVEDLKLVAPQRVVVPRSREVKPYAPRDPALMCGHPTTKAASGTCRCYYPCSFHGPWRKNEELAAPAHPVSNTAVDHPPHYNVGKFEVIDVIEDWRLGFNLGNVVKYVARAEHKGRELEDLDKAAWYIQREIARRKGKG
jgi:hypothetical protein